MRKLQLSFATAALLLLAGCAAFGLQAPQNFPERLAYGYSQNAALRTTAANALTATTISTADAEYVLGVTDQTRALLDAAKAASEAGDPSTATGRLSLALNVLDQLNAYLAKRQGAHS